MGFPTIILRMLQRNDLKFGMVVGVSRPHPELIYFV